MPRFLHPIFLRVAREFVMHGLGFDNYTSESCYWGHARLGKGFDEQVWAYEEQDASDSGLFLIDLTTNWTTSGILVHTPFSSHFPWEFYNNLPTCTRKQKAKLMEGFPADVTYLLNAADNLHITMAEACTNNRYMAPGFRKQTRCEELLPKISKNV